MEYKIFKCEKSNLNGKIPFVIDENTYYDNTNNCFVEHAGSLYIDENGQYNLTGSDERLKNWLNYRLINFGIKFPYNSGYTDDTTGSHFLLEEKIGPDDSRYLFAFSQKLALSNIDENYKYDVVENADEYYLKVNSLEEAMEISEKYRKENEEKIRQRRNSWTKEDYELYAWLQENERKKRMYLQQNDS